MQKVKVGDRITVRSIMMDHYKLKSKPHTKWIAGNNLHFYFDGDEDQYYKAKIFEELLPIMDCKLVVVGWLKK